jgi:hypothetical protein
VVVRVSLLRGMAAPHRVRAYADCVATGHNDEACNSCGNRSDNGCAVVVLNGSSYCVPCIYQGTEGSAEHEAAIRQLPACPSSHVVS